MLRSLIKLYLLVVLGAGLSVALINHAFPLLFRERITEEARESFRAFTFVLKEYVQRYPGAQREAVLAELRRQAGTRFELLTLEDLAPRLNPEQLNDLRAGKLVLLSMYTSDYILPLPDGLVARSKFDMLDSGIQALAYVVVALAMLFSVLFWVHYHWRDLRKLQDAARAFGAGRWSTRVQPSRKSNIYDLSRQFNEMARQIEDTIQQQRDLMHGISHELKTPLARLEFGLALLQSPQDSERERERQLALRKDVRELDELVTELLTLSRLEQGAGQAALMWVSVTELIDSVAADMVHDIAERALHLSVVVDGAPEQHVCDPRLVARALLNLLRNGIRYARRTIVLRAETGAAGALVLSVEDDGPGIPPDARARVFEPFYRQDASRDRHTGGFGLGLSIVRRVALVHGGDVVLEEAVTGGARFAITLPVGVAHDRWPHPRGHGPTEAEQEAGLMPKHSDLIR
ncbi:histidine kinase [Hylemonella gracilis str. Niagara R]|uniref:histidine kinase n=1 Tax=Hylemonella gracilis str. Niagara R TaxID=1458275 RepID=A0A016XHJ6_9BURK|nr:ATP-binding protein [Hylemonella gracilis]EYC51385.1 histidine kinase [Hylemonella gracilis str. Niagara R]